MVKIDWVATKKQQLFFEATADEVLFGGAAGGGKSYAQLMDAFFFALKYPKSKQLILRRTFPELEKSLIRVSLGLYPKSLYKYNGSKHTGTFKNGSIIDFGYCDSENDVFKYQSSEYDVIRFDELTHFTDEMYIYLSSRLRGANDFPKQIKSSSNPGGIGHTWVKKRFIEPSPPFEIIKTKNDTTRIFIPSLVQENKMLLDKDPSYIKRLRGLSEKDQKALLYGDWDIVDGQYFQEFSKDIHVIKPFVIPKHWRRYFTMDYGLDMLAGYWIAVDENGKAYVYKEIYEPNLIISAAAAAIKNLSCEKIDMYFAPSDLWNRRQDTGKSLAEIFLEEGIMLVKAQNDRVQGWFNLKEWLKPYTDEASKVTANLVIFESCLNLIRSLPSLAFSKINPNDVAREPHEITHAPDAIRYFVAGRPTSAYVENYDKDEGLSYGDQLNRLLNY